MFPDRIFSGMRPTGSLHLGHYHGALKNWVRLQNEFPCLFFAADWHALTTHYEDPSVIESTVWDMFVDWLSCGIDPAKATLFIQSRVPQHAELSMLLSFFTPLSWLERVPTYKDLVEKHAEQGRDVLTYGFLGYPLMQAADILIYQSTKVPVGEDQVSHIELTREIARRFNHLFGREKGFEEKAEGAVKKMGPKKAKLYRALRGKFQEQGNQDALEEGDLVGYAEKLGLKVPRFIRELAEHTYLNRVREDFGSGVRSGVNGTPTFFLDGRRHDGGWDLESLAAAITAEAEIHSQGAKPARRLARP